MSSSRFLAHRTDLRPTQADLDNYYSGLTQNPPGVLSELSITKLY